MEIMNLSGGGGSVIKSRKSYSVSNDTTTFVSIPITPVDKDKSIIVVTSVNLMDLALVGSRININYTLSFTSGSVVKAYFHTLYSGSTNGISVQFEVIEFN